MNKVLIAVITTLLLGGGLFYAVDPIDLHSTNCSTFQLKSGLNSEQKELFNIIIDTPICELADCNTGELFPATLNSLTDLNNKNPELHKRIVYYLTECK
jgi:hypothetical protein